MQEESLLPPAKAICEVLPNNLPFQTTHPPFSPAPTTAAHGNKKQIPPPSGTPSPVANLRPSHFPGPRHRLKLCLWHQLNGRPLSPTPTPSLDLLTLCTTSNPMGTNPGCLQRLLGSTPGASSALGLFFATGINPDVTAKRDPESSVQTFANTMGLRNMEEMQKYSVLKNDTPHQKKAVTAHWQSILLVTTTTKWEIWDVIYPDELSYPESAKVLEGFDIAESGHWIEQLDRSWWQSFKKENKGKYSEETKELTIISHMKRTQGGKQSFFTAWWECLILESALFVAAISGGGVIRGPAGNNDCRIYMGNLPPDIRTKDIDVFYKYGAIRDIDLKNHCGGPPFTFVEFQDPRDAEDAVYGRDGYDYNGYCLQVEFPRSGRGTGRGGGGGGGGGAPRGRYGLPSRRSENRVVVSGLPPSGSWQDLKNHVREAGDVCYADVYRDGTGVVEFVRKEDMTYAVRKLGNTKFRSHEGETAYIQVKVDRPRSPSYGRPRSRSRSHSRSNSRSRSYSPRRSRGSPRYSPHYSRSRSRT
ncbi:hypothetical protein P7K49_011532 [Saguinus oedipus]|uniref:Serine/arginine-rich splicing factor 1 n=1 Tax=Saguinus oedipus TaxID=9490 RepID=A0ABQ9VRL1_SAGOE|nr:hypothetical protein P7K49_011532 [Saguinus oedipus]